VAVSALVSVAEAKKMKIKMDESREHLKKMGLSDSKVEIVLELEQMIFMCVLKRYEILRRKSYAVLASGGTVAVGRKKKYKVSFRVEEL
jgi:hypothetical protein